MALVGIPWGIFLLASNVVGVSWDIHSTRILHRKLARIAHADSQSARDERTGLIRIVAFGSALYCLPYCVLALSPHPGPILGMIFASGAISLIIAQHILTRTMSVWTLPTPTLALALNAAALSSGWLGVACAGLALIAGVNAFALATASWRSSQALIASQLEAEENADTLELRVEARTAELETEKSRAEDASRLLSQLTGGIAHDFNIALAAIGSSAETLKALPPGDPRLERIVETISLASARASELTRKLLAYSRLQVLEPRLISINESVEEAAHLIRPLVGAAIRVETRLDKRNPFVFVDPAQISSALLNLAINARDAMPGGGSLVISTRQVDDHLNLGPAAVIEFADTGVGIEPQILDRIFDPYFTTKESGLGSGLGLSMVQGFVIQSEGCISVSSTPGAGATFRMAFPLKPSPKPEPAAHAPNKQPPTSAGNRRRVLLVEDDPLVQDALCIWLESAGYSVRAVSDGVAALRLVEPGPGIDLLITDVVIPGKLSGPQLAQTLRQRNPNMAVLIMSGYAQDKLDATRDGLEGAEFLQKPFTMSALESKVSALLAVQRPNPTRNARGSCSSPTSRSAAARVRSRPRR